MSNIGIQTLSSSTSQQYQYPLDLVNFTLTGLKAGTEIRCYVGTDPETCIEIGGIESSGTSFTFAHSSGGQAGYIIMHALGYQVINLPITWSSSDQTIPMQQQVDRQYFNPL